MSMQIPNISISLDRLTQLRESIKVFISLCLLSIITQLFPFIELAKEGIPLPFGNKFWASNWPTGKSPLPGLIVHLIPSVSFCVVLITTI
jgi:hypothetical protein